MTIRRRIIFIFVLSVAVTFGALAAYINLRIKPENMDIVRQHSILLVESKASEVGMWIYRKISEFRVLAQVPAVRAADVRGIAPLLDNLTESFKQDGDTMETFAYGGINGFSGFNWVNADAILDLIVYEDYVTLLDSGMEYSVGSPITSSDNREVVLFYYPVKGYNDEYEGLLCSAIPTVRLKEIVDTVHLYRGKTWLMTRDGTLLTSSSGYFHQRVLSLGEFERVASSVNASESGSLPATDAAGERCTLFYAPVPYARDWLFCTLVDDGEIFRGIDAMVRGLLGLCVALLCSSVAWGVFLARSIERPILYLQRQMDLVERGTMNAYFEREAKDEIYYLGNSYNRMLDEINQLIERIYEEQRQKRKTELQVLQGQIKPHFLYNTLDNVKWMAKRHGAEDIAKTITALSTFFRVFLSDGDERITLEQEFKHTRSYLDIQQIRYNQLLTYELRLDEAVRDFKVVKIIVQPLVENAIYHGIKNKKRSGRIAVDGARDGDRVLIRVTDDGVGMDAPTLEALRASLDSSVRDGHYGLHNIRERLKLAYGEGGSVSIESVRGEGTIVTLAIPYEEDGNRV